VKTLRPTLAPLALVFFLTCEIGAQDAEQPAETDAPAVTTIFDRVELKDGSVVLGEIVDMGGGTLTIKTAFGIDETVKIKWEEVVEITTGHDHIFELADGSKIKGKIARSEGGKVFLTSGAIDGESGFQLASIQAVNPPEKKDVELVGNLNFGAAIADGNTQTKNAAFNGEAVAQSAKQRLTLRGSWNYSEDSVSGITARNTRGSLKYDYFITEKVFLFASAFFEEDQFQDLNLRTALSAGPGYQFVKKGDFEEDWLKDLEAYGEAGLAYFNEDFKTAPDNRYVAARWSFKADWPFNPQVALFHYHEGYPGLENARDLYIITEQGARLNIWAGFVATLQVNWRWDNTPSPGFERSDTLYLVTLGYQFNL